MKKSKLIYKSKIKSLSNNHTIFMIEKSNILTWK